MLNGCQGKLQICQLEKPRLDSQGLALTKLLTESLINVNYHFKSDEKT